MVLIKRLLVFFIILKLTHSQVTIHRIQLRVDNFNPTDLRTFSGRYYANDEFYSPGGPIYIYSEGSGYTQYGSEILTEGAVYDLARETNGLLFTLETRFFGSSRPTPDTSLRNLQYLTLHQMLGDIVNLIGHIKENYNGTKHSKVILWGDQHGGSLSVWMRKLYPHLVDGAWASSAYINTILEYPQAWPNTINTIISVGGTDCGNVIARAFAFIENSVESRNMSYVERRLRLCGPVNLDSVQDVARLFWEVADLVLDNFLQTAVYSDIVNMCNVITSTEIPPENALDAFARWFTDHYFNATTCLNVNEAQIVASRRNIEWDSISTSTGQRQILWVVCAQIGQWCIANGGVGHPFGSRFDLNFIYQWCAKTYEEDSPLPLDFFANQIAQNQLDFGGLSIPKVDRVFFTQGGLDPSRNKGLTAELNHKAPVVVLPRHPAVSDINAPPDTHDETIIQTIAQARELILNWIHE